MNKADNNTILLAERFYTEDNMTCSEIAAKVGRNRRTIESWKKKFGWERKRAELIQSHSTMPQRIYKLWDKVTMQIEKDIDEGHEVSSSRCRLAIQLLERIPKAEQAEKAVSGKTGEKKADHREIAEAVRRYLELDESDGIEPENETEDKKPDGV